MQHSFREDVHEEVRNFVHSMMASGEKYVSERSIADKFNLKRGSSRDILLSMEGEGILERIPQKGYRFINYEHTDVTTIRAIRFALEREAARKAMHNATREDILKITLAYEEMERLDTKTFEAADMDFHKALIAASHDNMLKNMFDFITTPVFHGKMPVKKEMELTNPAHLEILTALKNRDWPEMEKLLCNHLGQVYRESK